MNQMSQADMAWLTGMTEGEASFATTSGGNAAKAGHRYPRIEIKSIDVEVLERIQSLTGIGKIAVEIRPNPKHNDCYVWRITNSRDVLDFLCVTASFGFRSDHRAKQMLELVDVCSQILARKASGESYRRVK